MNLFLKLSLTSNKHKWAEVNKKQQLQINEIDYARTMICDLQVVQGWESKEPTTKNLPNAYQ